MGQVRTLHEYLIQENPAITRHAILRPTKPRDKRLSISGTSKHSTPKGTKKSGSKPARYPKPLIIRDWKTLEPEPLLDVLQKTLSQRKSSLRDPPFLHRPLLQISNENSLESVLIQSNQFIILEALENTPRQVVPPMRLVRGGQAYLRDRTEPKFLPDWASICGEENDINILPGETKTGWSWDSTVVSDITDEATGEVTCTTSDARLSPIAQVLWYCILGRARYGYIITNLELVALRIGSYEPNSPGARMSDVIGNVTDAAIVEYKAIEWSRYGKKDEFTINLLLWILHLLAVYRGKLDNASLEDIVEAEILRPVANGMVYIVRDMEPESESDTDAEDTHEQDVGLEISRDGDTESDRPVVSPPPSFRIPESRSHREDSALPTTPQKRKREGRPLRPRKK
ncbi:hypothetical protein EJ05DRAFT_495537 [Pseudovirgaria hyperparasitica]|uniref:Uncharacterized protein n=1 Tax=Pseudovirgaria hyperparasitica TaxID=470096 RepID=A0A6A6WKH3_9PEZI|nr:uncharacterized protein EJ05DRAFT_495537 [Pseudovirgaria hyperparasitica]KAF2762668.1 hypothetical protein EJ05DRAFT_495537 [Pseudovirgaria hyperparasitica]